METRAGLVSAGSSSAGLLPLCPIRPQHRQSAIWHLVARPGMGRSDDDAPLFGPSERRAWRAQAYATDVRRSCPGHCERVGVSRRAPRAYHLSPTSPRRLSVGEWWHRIVEQVHLSCATEALGGVVV